MGYSYALLGDLRFDNADKRKRWEAALLTASSDAPDGFAYTGNGATVASVLAGLRNPPLGLFEETDAGLTVRTVVDKDDDACAALPQAFREAAAFGGRGELTVVGYVDHPGSVGARVRVKPKASTFEALPDEVIAAVQNSENYRSLDKGLDALIAEDVARIQNVLAATEAEREAIIRDAPDMTTALAKLRSALPSLATFLEKGMIPDSSVVKALVARTDADAVPAMRARLKELGFGTSDDERVQIAALAAALYQRGEAHDEIHALWLDAPTFFLRDHERLRALGRRDIDEQLASRLGQTLGDDENHRWIVEAFFATAGDDSPARAAALLDGDIRQRPGAVESLRWLVGSLEAPEYRTPVWDAFLRRVIGEQPWTSARTDIYDQIRGHAIEVLAAWKVPGLVPLVVENADRFGEVTTVRLLTAIGDPAALPWLEQGLAAAKRKDQRAAFTYAIMKCGGTPGEGAPAAAPQVGEHVIDVSPSGRASCKGCKEKIAKGELRFGEAAKNAFSESGEASMRWYHLRCAAEKKPKLFGPTLAAYKGEVPDRTALEEQVANAAKPKKK